MDPFFKLLARGTKLEQRARSEQQNSVVNSSNGQILPPQHSTERKTRKRKRAPATTENEAVPADIDFFAGDHGSSNRAADVGRTADQTERAEAHDGDNEADQDNEDDPSGATALLSPDEAKAVLRRHKIKVTWLNPRAEQPSQKKAKKKKEREAKGPLEKSLLYPQPLQSFKELQTRFGISARLAINLKNEAYIVPTEVQLATLPILLDSLSKIIPFGGAPGDTADLLTIAPTGSGKTIAFMIPLLHTTFQRRLLSGQTERGTSAIILAPTKELAAQIVNEGRKLAVNTGIRLALVKKGMHLAPQGKDTAADTTQDDATVVKADILVSTPGILSSICQEAAETDANALLRIQNLILDEADVLLDPLFREQTLAIWKRLDNPELRVSLWSATMGSNVEEMVQSIIRERLSRLSAQQSVTEAPLLRVVVGLKDSALPNIEHRLVCVGPHESAKLMVLRELIHPTTIETQKSAILTPVLVFTQTTERASALREELRYDIPAEAGGIARIDVLHAQLSDAKRDNVLARFRNGDVWVLITTDLLARGVDFRGVNGVVNYDIPTSSAAYVHRVGRTGRAGREGGVAVTLWATTDIPHLKQIVTLIDTAQKQKGGTSTVPQWLLDGLPNASKRDKQELKKKGVESRRPRGKVKDSRAARQARISTKAGYVRRQANKRKGAVLGSKRRKTETAADSTAGV